MQLLARLGTEPSYKSNKDAIHHAYSSVRHYIGRLGHHFRVANDLLTCASRLSDVLYGFEVRSVPIPTRSTIPPADGKTTLDSVVSRMLPSLSSDVEKYQIELAAMDAKYQLSRRFLDNYRESGSKPRVHAEVQVLEHFYMGSLGFVDGDSYITCSKPACFCCLLYFRAHPGHFVEPTSHQKIYLNWRPPDLDTQNAVIGEHHQRNILNTMTQAIRKEAFKQINEKTPPRAWHPDSLTGITESARGSVNVVQGIEEPNSRSNSPTTMDENADKESEDQQKSAYDPFSPLFDCSLDDSGSEGGVPLPIGPGFE